MPPKPARRRPARAAQDARARRRFREGLLRWYARHQRDLPWRRTRDPYHVLVSEIMLQQTQVDRVIPKYHEFLGRYPTLEALATADVADVTRTWYPLGYNIRPVHLHGIAREAVARYGGRLPADDKALRAMKGIGRYTAGRRAVVRLRGARPHPRHQRPARPRPRLPRRATAAASRRPPCGRSPSGSSRGARVYDFNQALMDFGATWCTARKPLCLPCPMRRFCRAYPWDAS